MLHHTGLAVNALFEAVAFMLEHGGLKVRGTFVTDVFIRINTALTQRALRIEFTPNAPPTPLVHGLGSSARRVIAGETPLVVEDVTVSVLSRGISRSVFGVTTTEEVLQVLTADWAINATSRLIWQSTMPGKKQVDLMFVPLRDPLAPNPKTGKVVSPHGLVGQSFDGDNIAVFGNKDHCARHLGLLCLLLALRLTRAPSPPQTASCGGGRAPSRARRSRPRHRPRGPLRALATTTRWPISFRPTLSTGVLGSPRRRRATSRRSRAPSASGKGAHGTRAGRAPWGTTWEE